MTAGEDVTTRNCPACHKAVPDAAFCGECGADRDRPVTAFANLLRPNTFATAPREPVYTPRMTSSLFPRLPRPARQPFRVALVLLLVTVVILSALRANGPLAAVAVLGGPMLFVMYMWQSDAFRDISRRALAIAAVTGAGLAVAYWYFTGTWLAGTYGISTAAGMAIQNILAGLALAITAGGVVVMVLPPVIVKLFRVPVRESVDGFVIGALGALSYMSAATITWMFPQIVAGLLDSQSAWRMFADSVTNGIIDPMCTSSLGGLVGLSMWFRPHGAHAGRLRGLLALFGVVAAGVYVLVWTVDSWALPYPAELAVNLTLAILTLINTRCAVQLVLLHDSPDLGTGRPVLCVHCEKVVPDMPFCVACGASALASSRSSRRLRRDCPPVPEAA